MAANPKLAVWVLDSLRLGGAERLAVQCASSPPPGWRVELIALQPPPETPASEIWGAALDRIGGQWHQLGMRRLGDGGEFLRLVRQLRRLRPALVHSHLQYAHIWTAAACRSLRLLQVATLHVMPPADADRGGRQAVVRRLEQLALRGARRRIYVSQAQHRAWSEPGGLESGPRQRRARIIPNGCDAAPAWTSAQRAAWRQRVGLAAGLMFLTVAVLRPEKGWHDWLQAAERLVAAGVEAQFVWVGGGPETAALTAAVARSPIRSRILLTGPRTDVSDWLRGADLFLFPSHGEALPTAVLEAMAQGVPVVATELAATREILGDCGSYAPPHQPEALARAALVLCRGDRAASARRQAADAGRRRWQEQFCLAAWAARLGRCYDELRGVHEGRRDEEPWEGTERGHGACGS